MITFALNHRVAPDAPLGRFLDLAVALGVTEVEIRNDLPGLAIADGTPAEEVRAEVARRGLTILSINALYPFNIWSAERARIAQDLIAYAAKCGARGIVMCPLNDAGYTASDAERLGSLRHALTQLVPMLRDAGVTGLVEPLGFAECSLRLKREAIEAIQAVNGDDILALVHDTFHHFVAGETTIYPERTGLVHISGVVDRQVRAEQMRDPHRVLVDRDDCIDNVGQVRDLISGGYRGPLSFEPFADSVSEASDIRSALESSMHVIRDADMAPAR